MSNSDGRSLLALGRAAGWVAVSLLLLGIPISVVTFVEEANQSPRSVLDLTGFVIAWLALAGFPLALVGAMVGLRLRTRAAPPLWAPTIMVAVGAGVLSWARGAWLLVPAGLLLVASALLEGRRRLVSRKGPNTVESVLADL